MSQADCEKCRTRWYPWRNEYWWAVDEEHSVEWRYASPTWFHNQAEREHERNNGIPEKCILVVWNDKGRIEYALPWFPLNISKEDLNKYLTLL